MVIVVTQLHNQDPVIALDAHVLETIVLNAKSLHDILKTIEGVGDG